MSEYKPVPVEAARQIAHQFDKSTVVILAYDPVHELTHTATYGKSAADKDAAASLVGDISQRQTHEDFRTTDQAARAESIEQLKSQINAIRDALEQIVVTEGEDTGVVLLSDDAPTKYDPERQCQVYTHDNFSPLGDALVALHALCEIPKASE